MNAANLVSALGNHLWQSTLFLMAMLSLAALLKRNKASIRYALLLAASLKFLIPFSLLIDVGQHFGQAVSSPMEAHPAVSVVLEEINEPFAAPPPVNSVSVETPAGASLWPLVIPTIWAAGSVFVLGWWLRGWRRMTHLVSHSSPLTKGPELAALQRVQNGLKRGTEIHRVVSVAAMEPGLFGIFRPVLLLPSDITTHLDEPQLDAVVAHELAHARRRDNLWGAAHLVVEVLFWFHPLVWWLGCRLIDERERACDEAVLATGFAPSAYAHALLRLCELRLASPVVCTSGIRSASLKERVLNIVANRPVLRLSTVKSLLLWSSVIVVVGVPVVFGAIRISAPLKTALRPQESTATGLANHVQGAPGAPAIHFEAATIKPSSPQDQGGVRGGCHGIDLKKTGDGLVNGAAVPLGRCVIIRARLGHLLFFAYGLNLVARSEGLPDWNDNTFFNVEAIAENPGNATQDQLLLMLQDFLVDQFKLTFHFEPRPVDGYALTIDKGGPKLQRSTTEDAATFVGAYSPDPTNGARRNTFTAHNVSMPALAIRLTNQSGLHGPLVDKTGLTGAFDFKLNYVLANQLNTVPGDPSTPSIFDAVQDQLGLKLVPEKSPIEFLIIEHAERPGQNDIAAAHGTATAAFPSSVHAQNPAKPQAFEIILIKTVSPATAGVPTGIACRGVDGVRRGQNGSAGLDPVSAPQGHCVAERETLSGLLQFVYEVDDGMSRQGIPSISGPDWAGVRSNLKFRIDAKAEDPATATTAQLREMFQSMLADRFKLKLHRESKQVDGYALVLDREGIKVKEDTSGNDDNPDLKQIIVQAPPGEPEWFAGWRVYKGSATMRVIAQTLSIYPALAAGVAPLPLMDKTALPGKYPVDLRFPRAPGREDADVVSQYRDLTDAAFKRQIHELGLRIQPEKVLVESIVIDHAEQPSENR